MIYSVLGDGHGAQEDSIRRQGVSSDVHVDRSKSVRHQYTSVECWARQFAI